MKERWNNPLSDLIRANGPNLAEMVENLLREGVDPRKFKGRQNSPLLVASRNGRFDVVSLLLEYKADKGELQWTGLFDALVWGDVDDVIREIDRGADLEHRDHDFRTPFLISIMSGDIRKVDVLVETGADISVTGRLAETPYHYAVMAQCVEMIDWLVEHGFDLEQESSYGSPLLTAVEADRPELVDALIRAGADVARKPPYSDSMMEEAQSVAVARLLEKAGGDIGAVDDVVKSRLFGYDVSSELACSRKDYLSGRFPRFGNSIPELASEPFWTAMAKSRETAYAARSRFEPDSNDQ